MDEDGLQHLLRRVQDGVVSRRQVREVGGPTSVGRRARALARGPHAVVGPAGSPRVRADPRRDRRREFGVAVEPDGRAFHDNPTARDRDLERELDTVVTSGLVTVRLGYGQVLGRGCVTVAKIADLLARSGWPGPIQRCPQCP